MATHTNNGFTVTVEDDGAILVNPGDMLSGYSMAIEGDYKHIDDYRHRRHQSSGPIKTEDLRVIDNKDLILSGETLYHFPTRQKWDRKQQKPVPQITLAKVLSHVRDPMAACMTKKVWALGGKPDERWKAGWYTNEHAVGAAKFLASCEDGYKYRKENEEKYFRYLDRKANNVFETLKPFYQANDITGLVHSLQAQHQAITDGLSEIADWANNPQMIASRPHPIFFNAWMNRMMRDETTALSCYIEVYAPNGLR